MPPVETCSEPSPVNRRAGDAQLGVFRSQLQIFAPEGQDEVAVAVVVHPFRRNGSPGLRSARTRLERLDMDVLHAKLGASEQRYPLEAVARGRMGASLPLLQGTRRQPQGVKGYVAGNVELQRT